MVSSLSSALFLKEGLQFNLLETAQTLIKKQEKMAWTSASHKNYHRDYFSLMYTCLVSGGKGSYINVLLLLMIYRTSEVPSYFN